VILRHFYSKSPEKSERKSYLKIGLRWGSIFLLFFWAPAYGFTPPGASNLPPTIQVRGQNVDLHQLKNPLKKDSSHLKQYIKEGGSLYFKNCFLCHGDLLDGKGVFSDRFFPPPANLHQLYPSKSENYVYWRIMKGGAGGGKNRSLKTPLPSSKSP